MRIFRSAGGAVPGPCSRQHARLQVLGSLDRPIRTSPFPGVGLVRPVVGSATRQRSLSAWTRSPWWLAGLPLGAPMVGCETYPQALERSAEDRHGAQARD